MARHGAPGVLGRVGRWVEWRPGTVLVALLVSTLVLGFFAAKRETSGDFRVFTTRSELSGRQARVDDEFGGAATQGRVQLLFDAGQADVLADEPIAAAARLERALLAAPGVRPVLADIERPIVSFATPVIAALESQGIDPETAPGFAIDQAAATVLADPELGGGAVGLYSGDLDIPAARARGGLMLVNLDTNLDQTELRRASAAVLEVLDGVNTDGVRVLPFSRAILATESAEATNRELPLLFGLGMILIAVILAFNYRTLSDVLIGLTGLALAVVWMNGIAVLLGPAYLGVSGPFTVISNVAPVVFLGIGVDDTIQLTARYRQHQAEGSAPPVAARRALITVGGAIVLTSVTTMVGFLTNGSSPIPPVQDFGVFTAAGQFAATGIMLLLVPSVRNLLDSRRASRRAAVRDESLTLTRLVARTTVLGRRAPVPVAALALVITVGGLLSSLSIPTRFDPRDFLPRGSPVAAAATTLDELFGGELNELTFVLAEGDLTTPDAANALIAAEAAIRETGGVRRTGDAPVQSIATVVREVAAQPRHAAAARSLGWTGTGFSPTADVAGLYALAREARPEQAPTVVSEDGSEGVLRIQTAVGQDGAERLRTELAEAVEPLRDAGVAAGITSQALVREETNKALTRSGTNAIVLALLTSLLLLTGYFWIRVHRPVLGLITMTAAVFVVGTVLGTMRLLDIPYNGLTVTIAAIAVGVGVTFAIHMTYRTVQELDRGLPIDDAVQSAVESTGAALASSGATTVAGFGVLAFSGLIPIRQFGIVSSMSILYAMVAAVLILPSVLVLWGRSQRAVVAGVFSHDETIDLGAGMPAGDPVRAEQATEELWVADSWADEPPEPDSSQGVPSEAGEQAHRFHVRLEGEELQEALAEVPDGVQTVELVDGGALFHLRDGGPVEAVFAVRGHRLLLEPARGRLPADEPDLVVLLGELPAGAKVDDLRVENGSLMLAGTVHEPARPEDPARA